MIFRKYNIKKNYDRQEVCLCQTIRKRQNAPKLPFTDLQQRR